MHEAVEALGIVFCEAEIFIEIEGDGLRKIEFARTMKRDKSFVHPERGAASGEAENDFGICANSSGNDASSFLADLFAVLFEDYKHLGLISADIAIGAIARMHSQEWLCY